MVIHKNERPAVLAEIKDKDWREDLKHVEPHKDASAPVIERMHSLYPFARTRTVAHTAHEHVYS